MKKLTLLFVLTYLSHSIATVNANVSSEEIVDLPEQTPTNQQSAPPPPSVAGGGGPETVAPPTSTHQAVPEESTIDLEANETVVDPNQPSATDVTPNPTTSSAPTPQSDPAPGLDERASLFDYTCEETKQNPTLFNKNQKDCLCNKETLQEHQKSIFDLKSSNTGPSLLDLLKERDQIHAQLSMTDSLLDIWNEYQQFLTDNKGVSNRDFSSLNGLNGLTSLRNFIQNNKDKVSRFNMVSEVINSLNNRNDIKNFQTDDDKIHYLKDMIRAKCEIAPYPQSLYMCQNDAWSQIQLEAADNTNPQTPGAFLNKLANTIVKLDGNMDLNNIPDLFVDKEEFRNPTGLNQFSTDIVNLLDKSIEGCRRKVLLAEGDSEDCLSTQPAGEEAQRIVRTLKSLDLDYEFPQTATIGDITQAYLEVSKKTNATHEEVAGGSVTQFMELINEVGDVAVQVQTINHLMKDNKSIDRLRNEFNSFSKERLEGMAQHINKMGLQDNKNLFAQYGIEDAGPVHEKANALLMDILGQEATDLFTADIDGNLVINPNSIAQVVRMMINKHDEVENQQKELSLKLQAVSNQIAQIKSSKEYQDSNALKDFIWDKVANSCQKIQSDGSRVDIYEAGECQLNSNGQTAVNDLLKINDKIIGYRERQNKSALINNVATRCRTIVSDEDTNERWGNLCNEAVRQNAHQTRVDARRNYYRNPANHNVIYSYDSEGRVVDKYTPKSNLALFLPQAAYTVNEQLPFYFIQRPGLNMAIDQWRFLGKQQKTQRAYWNAWNQSWQNNSVCGAFGCFYNTTLLETASPTFGNSGFNFGTDFTTPVSL